MYKKFTNRCILKLLLNIVALSFILIACKKEYDHIYTPCEGGDDKDKTEKELEDIKQYLFSMGQGSTYMKDVGNGIYYKRVDISDNDASRSNTTATGSLNPYSVYKVDYKAYLMDGTREKSETLFDAQAGVKMQPHLGPYVRLLPKFGIALSKLLDRPTGSKDQIDFYLTSTGAFSTCGWQYSPFGVEVPPDVPVHFIVTVYY